jgi:hypothetical protein
LEDENEEDSLMTVNYDKSDNLQKYELVNNLFIRKLINFMMTNYKD